MMFMEGKDMRLAWITGALAAAIILGAPSAFADPIDIGGRTAISANFSLNTINADDLDDDINVIFFTTQLTRTTESGRFEFGGGLTVAGTITDDVETSTTTLSALARINSDPLGPEENIILYGGFLTGVTFIVFEFGDFEDDDEVGAFGPKFGAEYYITPNVALQLEDTLIVDTEKNVTNTLAIGAKYLF